MGYYRVDFKLLRDNPRQNRNVFTFTPAKDEAEAERKIRDYHEQTERIQILKVTKER